MSDSRMPQRPQIPQTPEILTPELKQSIKNIKDARTQIATKLEALKSEKDATKKSEISDKLEEKITSGYNAVNEILSSFGVSLIDIPAVEDVIGNNFDIQSMYQPILDLELPALVEDADEEAKEKHNTQQAQLNAIKAQLTGEGSTQEKSKKGGFIRNSLLVITAVTGLGAGAVSIPAMMQRNAAQNAEVVKTKDSNKEIAENAIKVLVDGGDVVITEANEVNTTLETKFKPYEKVNLTADQMTLLGGGPNNRAPIEAFYRENESGARITQLVDPISAMQTSASTTP
jgi:hypothetical protein